MVPIFLLMNRMATRRSTVRKIVKPERKELDVDYCRTCLSTEGLVGIFLTKESEKKRSDDLKLVTGLNIKLNDGLSQKICSKCLEIIHIALQFRRTSKKTETALLDMIYDRKTKKIPSKATKSVKKPLKEEVNNDIDFNYEDVFDDDFQNELDFSYNEDNVKSKHDIETKVVTRRRRRDIIPNATSYKCNTCNKEFRMKATYKAHLRFHTNYCVCESCGKRCRNNNQLQEHKRAKHGLGRIHKCAYCVYSSATKEALTIHERRHTGERPYVCDHCGATFHRRSNLVQHIAIHLPEKNFQCDMCPKRLKSRKFLQIHKHNAHTGRRYGYLCSICDHRFEKPNKVRAHTRRVHGLPDDQQGPIARCTLCPKREKSHKRLQVHIYKRHKQKAYRFVCPVCRATFAKPSSVRKHLIRTHNVAREQQGAIEKHDRNLPIMENNLIAVIQE